MVLDVKPLTDSNTEEMAVRWAAWLLIAGVQYLLHYDSGSVTRR